MVTTRAVTSGAPGRTSGRDRQAPVTDIRASGSSATVVTSPAPREAASAAGPTGAELGATPRAASRGDRMYALDALRFAAAIGVVLYHFISRWHRGWGNADPGQRFGDLAHVATYFALAPELFFVVSGFVILWTVWGRSVPKVVASRLSRIYPAYWAALALTVFLLMVMWPTGKRISWAEVAVNVTLLQQAFGVRHVDGVYWTLWAELRFYLLIVVLVAIGLTRRRVLAFAALWPAAALSADLLNWGLLQTVLISRYAPLFAGGMLLFLIYRDGHARVPWLLLGGNVVLAVHNIVPAQMRSLTRNTMFEPNPWLLGVLTVGCFATVAVVALTPLRKISWAPLATLGALTYPLYLIHQFWGWWAIDRLDPRLPTYVTLAIAIILSVALAAFIHYAVEQRWTPVARRWIEARLTALGARLPARHGGMRTAGPEGARDVPRGGAPGTGEEPVAHPVFSDVDAVAAVFSNTYTAEADDDRRNRQEPGRPPTVLPGSSAPSRRSAQNAGVRFSSSSTADPTPPGR